MEISGQATRPVQDAGAGGDAHIDESGSPGSDRGCAQTPGIRISGSVADECGAVIFTVAMSCASEQNVVLELATVDGSAMGGVDFETGRFRYSTDGGLTWLDAAGDRGTRITIPANLTAVLVEVATAGHLDFQGEESFTLRAAPVVGVKAADTELPEAVPDTASIGLPDVAIADIGNGDGDHMFRVGLTRPSASDITLDLQLTGASATAGTDFELTDFRYSEDGGVTWKDACGMDGTEVSFTPGNTAILVETVTREADLFAGDEAFCLAVKRVVSGSARHAGDAGIGTAGGNMRQAGAAVEDSAVLGPGVGQSPFFYTMDGDKDLAGERPGWGGLGRE